MKTTTDVTILLDRSGSMASILDPTIAGVNAFIRDQRLETGTCNATLIQFDSEDHCEVTFEGLPIDAVRPLSRRSFRPRGGTPLYDAIALAITRTSARVKKGKEVPVFVIVTDGEENMSREHTEDSISDLIRRKEKTGWRFVFLGANQDAILAAGRIGIDSRRSLTYQARVGNVEEAYAAASRVVRRLRVGEDAEFLAEERRAQI